MAASKADLITHPIRTRILAALMGRNLTTQQIAQLLPDVPPPSLYRHLRVLHEAGILDVVDEIRVKGAPTRVYGVRRGQTRIAADNPEDADEFARADHLRSVTTFLNTLAEMLRTYLEQSPIHPAEDPIHCLMEPLHLSLDEYRAFTADLNAFLETWRGKTPAPDRKRLVFAHLALPDLPDPPLS